MGRQQNLIYENFAFARCVLKNIMSNKGVIMLRNDLFKFLVLFVFAFVFTCRPVSHARFGRMDIQEVFLTYNRRRISLWLQLLLRSKFHR